MDELQSNETIKVDTIVSLFAVVIIFAALIEFIFHAKIHMTPHPPWLRLLSEVIFWGSVHGVTSYFVLFACPEYRELRAEHTLKGRNILHKCFAVFIAVALLTFTTVSVGTADATWAPLCFFTYTAVVVCYNFYHTARQTLGLALLYNENAAEPLSPERAAKIRSRDGRTFTALLLFLMFSLTISFLGFYWPNLGLMPERLFFIPVLGFFIAGQFVFNSWRDRHWAGDQKFLFSLRTLLYPLIFLSPLGSFGVVAVHGTEHIVCNWRILYRSRGASRSLMGSYFAFVIGMMALYSVVLSQILPLTNVPFISSGPVPIKTLVLFSLYAAIGPSHFVLDAYMFRMKDASTRIRIGPLLAPRRRHVLPREVERMGY